jgi:pyruvate dehydrogenase E2 component (dihydrolipoamide acetyltransferase)
VRPASSGAPITVDDIKRHARSGAASATLGQSAPTSSKPGALPQQPALPNFERWGAVRREKMSTIRRVTAEHLSQAWNAVPHVTQHDKADITDLEGFRKAYGKPAEAAGGKLTVTAILVRVLAEAMKKFPQFNASIDMANAEIIYKDYVHVGVAIDTEHGLLVPSIKNADSKGLVDIAVELAELSAKARDRKLSIDELQGGGMTITNLGGIGGTAFTPIVSAPEVAILGVSRGTMEPVWKDGEFVPRTMMPISLSYDHRLINGADAARFARWVCEALEQPMSMFMDA